MCRTVVEWYCESSHMLRQTVRDEAKHEFEKHIHTLEEQTTQKKWTIVDVKTVTSAKKPLEKCVTNSRESQVLEHKRHRAAKHHN